MLFTPSKQQLKTTTLAQTLGPVVAKSLTDNRRTSLNGRFTLENKTLQTGRFALPQSVVIACYANEKMMEHLDGLKGLVGVVAVPYIRDAADVWQKRWNAHVHGAARQAQPAPLIEDRVVAAALTSLTILVNVSHGILHPRDKQSADMILRILRAKGHELDPVSIKSWAIRNGWDPKGGEDLAKLAARIAGLKGTPSLTKFNDPAALYARWQSRPPNSPESSAPFQLVLRPRRRAGAPLCILILEEHAGRRAPGQVAYSGNKALLKFLYRTAHRASAYLGRRLQRRLSP